MTSLTLRFFGELNDFLPPERRDQPVTIPYQGRAAIKDTIEALGVPHPEIAQIVANDTAAPLSYIAQAGDTIAVYPLAQAEQHPAHLLLHPRPQPRFILDVHLGRLAEYLRWLGFDTLYRNDYDDPELARIAHDERRILLTRDLGLLKRGIVIYGSYVRATDPPQQVIEIVRRFNFFAAIAPFRRCSRCNGLLHRVAKAAIEDCLLPETRRHYEEFHRCASCGHIYWKGSHYERMQQFIAEIRQHAPRS